MLNGYWCVFPRDKDRCSVLLTASFQLALVMIRYLTFLMCIYVDVIQKELLHLMPLCMPLFVYALFKVCFLLLVFGAVFRLFTFDAAKPVL
jgi:hypothetical protein